MRKQLTNKLELQKRFGALPNDQMIKLKGGNTDAEREPVTGEAVPNIIIVDDINA